MPTDLAEPPAKRSSSTEAPVVGLTGLNAQTFFFKDALKSYFHRLEFDEKPPSEISTLAKDSIGKTKVEQTTSEPSHSVPDAGVVRLPARTLLPPREVKLQEWEGQVQEVRKQYFSARLVDLTNHETEETEEADIPISDVSESDIDLLVPGATFRWIIGYRYVHGEKDKFARVAIRRLPVWTETQLKLADQEAVELHNALFRHRSNRATRP